MAITAGEGAYNHLGEKYVNSDWQPVLKAIMESEDDDTALNAVSAHHTAALSHYGIKICIPVLVAISNPAQKPNQLALVESKVMESVHCLKERNCIFGKLPSVDELVEPPEERELPEFILDGSNKAIADAVHSETAVENGEVIDINDSDDSDEGNSRDVMVPSHSMGWLLYVTIVTIFGRPTMMHYEVFYSILGISVPWNGIQDDLV
ncbi:hypothetical protein F5J12DRAFT_779654 [Pisolithus orientalis]|uniref:uncharacterized protein n=1 Tax=Pisolithus orientalis TaxID=936130 RepID=UPI0022248EF2|nr:uncharacterized protein F5J12DRAFT_779654 [Pisolithus orientalis]KAI6030513.1 hypothetical protein F5J12DRAFT_779654 [Pisolithus orientalis]